MASASRAVNGNRRQQHQDDEEEVELKAKVIDWDQFDELPEGEQTEIDPEADAFIQIAPPKPGVYKFKVAFARDNPQVKYTDRQQAYYSAGLELSLDSDDPDLEGAKVYPTVTSLIGRGKTSSTMATVMIKGGGKLTSTNTTDKQLMRDFKRWVDSEPTIDCEVDWQVGYKEDRNADWKPVYTSYDRIPRDKEGNVPFRFEFKAKDGSVITTGAMLQVKTWFANDGKAHTATSKNGVAGASKPLTDAPRKRVVVNDPDEEPGDVVEDLEDNLNTQVVAQQQQAPTQTNRPVATGKARR